MRKSKMDAVLIAALSALALAGCDSSVVSKPAVAVPVVAVTVTANEPSAEELKVFNDLNAACKDSPYSFKACDGREQYSALLESKGFCYGEGAADSTHSSWKKCGPRAPQADYVDGYNAADTGCRDSSSPMSEDKAACQERERFSKLLGSIKWCYGEGEHSSQTAQWARCKEPYAESDTNPATQELKNITLLRAGDLPWTSQFVNDLGPQRCLLTGFAKSFDEARMQINQMEVKNGRTVIKEESDRILFLYSDALLQKRMLRTVYKDLSTCEAEQRK